LREPARRRKRRIIRIPAIFRQGAAVSPGFQKPLTASTAFTYNLLAVVAARTGLSDFRPLPSQFANPPPGRVAIGASFRGVAMSVGEGSGTQFQTVRGRDFPTLRQFTVFLENRVGQLLEVVRRFESSQVRIVALSLNEATECAFVRFLLSHPDDGREILERAGLAMIESDLIGLQLPPGSQPLLQVCTALLQAEINIVQAYPLMMRPNSLPAVALMVDNTDLALETLANKGFIMLSEADLLSAD
jgi:hypothetical protein